MRLFGLGGRSPYMSFDRRLPNNRSDLLASSRYQIVPSPRSLPMAQVSLSFRRNLPAMVNPDMTLVVLIDRSGSMGPAFSQGHVEHVAKAIWQHVYQATDGYILAFYDDTVSRPHRITSLENLQAAVEQNFPIGGGTYVLPALEEAVARYWGEKGLYIIVITDGEFSDKLQVQDYVLNQLLPRVTPQNPYAFRIHFIGAGEEADHLFLQQIEAEAQNKGIPVVSQHHHAHLSHCHTSILDEMDRALIGVGFSASVGEPDLRDSSSVAAFTPAISHIIDQSTPRAWDCPVGDFGFLPRRIIVGFEYVYDHPTSLPVDIRFTDLNKNVQELLLLVPLPKDAGAR